MRRVMWGLVCLAGIGGAANAQDRLCAQYWFGRNLIYDRAGHCFGSPLGRAIFNNADCTGQVSELPPEAAATVALIREMEAEWECSMDVSAIALPDFPEHEQWFWLQDIPVPDGWESACVGYRGAPIELHAARDAASLVTGQVPTGGNIPFDYIPRDGWIFVSGHGVTGLGWMPDPDLATLECEMFAG